MIPGMSFKPVISKKTFQKKLLSWFHKEKRPLPWRNNKDPYRIWISEIMLQQTQVATVIPYYSRWLKAFPTLSSLARAPLSQVLTLWEGLGYYRRARMLHQTARFIARKLQGRIPEKADLLEQLPGIGRYTAGAIASIAFHEKVPVLDGNVIRVLTRLFAIRSSIDKGRTLKTLWELAGSLLPDHSPGDFNQAMMELGATICHPQNPACEKCPLAKLCVSRRLGNPMTFPRKTRKEKYEKIRMFTLILESENQKTFLCRQPPGHWWHGLWTFPFWDSRKELSDFLKQISCEAERVGKIRHSVTRYHITLDVYHSKLIRKIRPRVPWTGQWVRFEDLRRVALPSPHRKAATLATRCAGKNRLLS